MNESKEQRKVLVIGAGASGLMAAVEAARGGASVTVIEHNDRPGRKLLITGSGKCNFTNMLLQRKSRELEDVIAGHYHGDTGFAEAVIRAFDAQDTVGFFRELGVEPAFRRYPYDEGIYVYPASMEAGSVLGALIKECGRLGVRFIYGCEPKHIRNTGEITRSWELETTKGCQRADAVIFAVGSNAAPKTGSDSSIYPLIKELGHRFSPFLPALCGLKPEPEITEKLKGVRTEALVSLHVYSDNDMMLYQSRGEVQISSEGISGVCVMDISRHAATALKRGYTVELSLRLLPWLTKEELRAYVEGCFKRYNNALDTSDPAELSDLLSGALPHKLSAYIMEQAMGSEKPMGCDKTGERADTGSLIDAVCSTLRDLRFRIKKTAGFEYSQSSSGGVSTLEVDPTTMESRLHKGIYFCGELLDADGRCGGYNLQFAWSTGHIAGKTAACRIGES